MPVLEKSPVNNQSISLCQSPDQEEVRQIQVRKLKKGQICNYEDRSTLYEATVFSSSLNILRFRGKYYNSNRGSSAIVTKGVKLGDQNAPLQAHTLYLLLFTGHEPGIVQLQHQRELWEPAPRGGKPSITGQSLLRNLKQLTPSKPQLTIPKMQMNLGHLQQAGERRIFWAS